MSLSAFIFQVLTLALLEVFLSLDNAVVLALIARELPEQDQKKALRYGLWGAVILRLAAVAIASELMHFSWVKVVGGGYLLYLAIRYFFSKGKDGESSKTKAFASFWKTVVLIEFMDLAFAVDSILAAVAMTNSYLAIVFGGLIGVVAIRFAAQGMIRLLSQYPRLESLAYFLIAGVGLKVAIEGVHSFW